MFGSGFYRREGFVVNYAATARIAVSESPPLHYFVLVVLPAEDFVQNSLDVMAHVGAYVDVD